MNKVLNFPTLLAVSLTFCVTAWGVSAVAERNCLKANQILPVFSGDLNAEQAQQILGMALIGVSEKKCSLWKREDKVEVACRPNYQSLAGVELHLKGDKWVMRSNTLKPDGQ